MKTKIIMTGIMVLLVGALAYLVYSVMPVQISPLNGMVINKMEFNFEFKNADKILISKDRDFGTAIILDNKEGINLPPGTYYWKAKGAWGESEVRNFTIKSAVIFEISEDNESLILKNSGNVDLNISISPDVSEETSVGVTRPVESEKSTEGAGRNMSEIEIEVGRQKEIAKAEANFTGREA